MARPPNMCDDCGVVITGDTNYCDKCSEDDNDRGHDYVGKCAKCGGPTTITESGQWRDATNASKYSETMRCGECGDTQTATWDTPGPYEDGYEWPP